MTYVPLLKLLVPTKLSPPPAQPRWVRRERLIARLGPGPQVGLTVVIAPAGFGKSTLVAQWLQEAQEAERAEARGAAPPPSFAWLTLDEHDQDGLRFLAYVAGAIERVLPEAMVATRPLLAATEPPPLYVVAQALLVDLSALPARLTLVLDDYHAITAEPVHQAVGYLLRNWPSTCRLVILSRIDPPLPLARLRAAQQLNEVRAADLRFTPDEAGALLANLFGRTPDAAEVAALYQETEGWAIALQLAALAAQQNPSVSRAPTAARQITEYLADEVFDQQPSSIRLALLALAVPERICAGLGAALLGPPDDLFQAEEILDQLVRANLFLLPLDGEGRWYRFHPLFRNLLLRRLALSVGKDALRMLELRAARWFEAEGLFEEALRHYLAAGAEEAAADLVERHMFLNLGREVSTAPPGFWLRMLPEGLSERRPGLALIGARLSSFNTDVPALEARIAQVDALLEAPATAAPPLPWPTFMADLATLRGSLRYWQGRPAEAIAHLHAALELGPITPLAIQALHILGKALVAEGRYAEGVAAMQAGLPTAAGALGRLNLVARALALCGMHATAGTVADLAADAGRLSEAVAALGLGDFWVCYAEAYSGRAAYERSDLGAAARCFAAVVRRRYQINAPIYVGCLTGLTQIAIIQGDLDGAAAYTHELRTFAGEVGGAYPLHQALGCAVRLALARGDLAAAREVAQGIGRDFHEGINTWFGVEPPRLSQATALLASGDRASLAQADALLAEYLAEVEPLHNVRLQVGALATQALLRQAQGRQADALATLERAIALAAPRGFVRSLVDRGPALEPLLVALAERSAHGAYLAGVLSAFGNERQPHEAVARLAPAVPELLTPRETEILALLAARWSDKEIAAQLVIAPNTVRKHTSTIFSKLGVGGRREAVEVARALGLLAV